MYHWGNRKTWLFLAKSITFRQVLASSFCMTCSVVLENKHTITWLIFVLHFYVLFIYLLLFSWLWWHNVPHWAGPCVPAHVPGCGPGKAFYCTLSRRKAIFRDIAWNLAGGNVILRGIFHVVSCFPLNFMLYHENLDYFSDSVWRLVLYYYPRWNIPLPIIQVQILFWGVCRFNKIHWNIKFQSKVADKIQSSKNK